jgi:hypothetical protein
VVSRRTDAVRRVFGWLVRGALLAVWTLVGWGTLLLLATAVGAVRDGPGIALLRLLPTRDTSPWGWLNGFSAAFALAVWAIALGLFLWSRRLSAEANGPGN